MSIHAYLPRTRIAYFTMEIGLRTEIHTYSAAERAVSPASTPRPPE